MCPDKLSAQDMGLEALARDVRNVSLKSDISSFPALVLAEITGHQSGTFGDQLWKSRAQAVARSFCNRASWDFFVPGTLSYLSKLCDLRCGGGKNVGLLQCSVIYMLLCATEEKGKSTHPTLECEQFSPITQEQSPQELVMCNAPVIKQWE